MTVPQINTEACTIYEINQWLRDIVAATALERRHEIISKAPPEILDCAGDCLRVYTEQRLGKQNSFSHGLSEILALFDLMASMPNGEIESPECVELMLTCLSMSDEMAKTIEIHLKDGTFWPVEVETSCQ